MMPTLMKRAETLLFLAFLGGLGLLQADPLTLRVQSADPLVAVGGLGGGRFKATLNGVPIHVYCIDFAHYFNYNTAYSVDVTPLYGDLAGQTRYGGVPLNGWNYQNSGYTAVQRYMMAAWLTTQYAPYFATWSDPTSQSQARGIQSAIWALLDPFGAPSPPSASTTTAWLTAARNVITGPDYDEPTDPFYRYFRVVSPADLSIARPQEFIITVTPEPASILMLGGVLGFLGVGVLLRRRSRSPGAVAPETSRQGSGPAH